MSLMVFNALLRALPQIALPPVRSVFARSLAITVGIFAGFGALAWLGLRLFFAWMEWPAVNGFAGAAVAVFIALGAGWLLFRAIAMAVVGLFSDIIVEAVELASYPDAHARACVTPFGEGLRTALWSLARAIGGNILALPLYFVLLPTGVGAVAVFLILNAYLLGRDLADLVEQRHRDMAPFSRGERWRLGLVFALLFLAPVINLFAPVWSIAAAVHLFHRTRPRPE